MFEGHSGLSIPGDDNDWTLGSFKAAGAVTPGVFGDAMRRFAANPNDAAAATLRPSRRSRQNTHDLRRDPAARWPRSNAAADRDGHGELPHLSRHEVEEVQAKLQELAGKKVEARSLDNTPSADASPLRKESWQL